MYIDRLNVSCVVCILSRITEWLQYQLFSESLRPRPPVRLFGRGQLFCWLGKGAARIKMSDRASCCLLIGKINRSRQQQRRGGWSNSLLGEPYHDIQAKDHGGNVCSVMVSRGVGALRQIVWVELSWFKLHQRRKGRMTKKMFYKIYLLLQPK